MYGVTRSRSVSDLAGYYRYSDRYKPQWHTVYQTIPYKWRRDWDLILFAGLALDISWAWVEHV
ncbi:hypothetical protein TELCIR_07826 [Teladorsagia circumcincta]|uniref:Uncharacterized protein n=1 Tax=Teladorsagia circumcincta TaxID=45464 RepID=A0A2G9UJK2_TELCI|nr:hypothetical protein TELCIR_07826 [Teladorsagia circumcincta]